MVKVVPASPISCCVCGMTRSDSSVWSSVRTRTRFGFEPVALAATAGVDAPRSGAGPLASRATPTSAARAARADMETVSPMPKTRDRAASAITAA